jgi:hypothetical protein
VSIRGRRRRFSHWDGRRICLVDVLPDRTEDFARDGAVAGIGKRAHRFGKLGRDTGGYRDFPLAVYLACVAHTLFFGYELKRPRYLQFTPVIRAALGAL